MNITIQITIGCAIVALFKWLKTRKTGSDKKLDKEMERIRAEIATLTAVNPAGGAPAP